MLPNTTVSILNIPLILDLICQRLTHKEIQHCNLVSRAWREAFAPYLWKSIFVGRKCSLKRFRTPEVHDALLRHLPYVQIIVSYYGDLFRWLQYDLPKTRQQRRQGRRQAIRRPGLLQGASKSYCSEGERRSAAAEETDKGKHNAIDNLSVDDVSLTRLWIAPSSPVALKSAVEKTPPTTAVISLLTALPPTSTPQPLLMTPLVFRNLTTLKSMFQSGSHLKAEENNNSLLQILTLVEASPRLETFEINHFIFKKHLVLRLATIIRNHPSLKNFSFKPKKYTRDLVLLLLNCGRLERLAIACCPMLGSREFRAEQTKALMGMPETNIRDLDFGGVSFWSQLDTMLVPFLRKCSKLKRFLFPSYYRPIDLAGLIRTHLPELSQLDFTNSGSDDGMFASAINACRTVEEFKGKMAVWASELTVRALIQPRHAVTLKEVCFANCVRIRGAHIQMILKSCPNLAGFHGMDTNHTVRPLHEDPVFCVADMESDPGEWTCKELKVLSLKYKETDEGETFPKIIYEQISRLTKLEHLFLERKILPALPATVATQSAAADATITADIPAPATSETSASPNTTTASWLSTAPVTEPLSEAAGSKMAIADTDINANNSGAKNKSEEERRRSNRSGDGTLEMDEQESTRDGKLEEALTSFVTLQRLRSLNMANLHGPFYKTQRQWLYENIPTLEYIALY